VAGYGLRVNAWRVVVTCNDCRRARLPSVLLRAGLVGVVLIMPARLVGCTGLVMAWRVGVLLSLCAVIFARVLCWCGCLCTGVNYGANLKGVKGV